VPELPEVETVRRGLNQVTLNQTITGGDVLLPRTIAHPLSAVKFLAGLNGVTIAQWHRQGKYLLAELAAEKQEPPRDRISCPPGGYHPHPPTPSPIKAEGEQELFYATDATGHDIIANPQSKIQNPLAQRHEVLSKIQNPAGWLGVHLRMTGQLLWLERDQPLHKHTRVRLFFGESRELRFVDQRTFGQMWWVSPTQTPETIILGLKRLGPDPFSEEFSFEYLVERLRSRRRPIKNALLDQQLVAGIGNIYADEALFKSGVRPTTLCTSLSLEQIARLRTAIIEVLQASIEAGGTTFSNFLNVQGINGNYGGVAWVYNRHGQPCRDCGASIQKLKLAGRSSHFCPQCQPE
jgi:formamidopyrimidine-DNA glycosylase